MGPRCLSAQPSFLSPEPRQSPLCEPFLWVSPSTAPCPCSCLLPMTTHPAFASRPCSFMPRHGLAIATRTSLRACRNTRSRPAITLLHLHHSMLVLCLCASAHLPPLPFDSCQQASPLVRHWHNLRSASQPPSLPSIRPPLSEMRASPLDCCLPDRHCQTSATQPPLPGPVRFGNSSVLGSPVPTSTPNLLGNQVSVNAEQFQTVHGPLVLVNSFGLNSNSREPLFHRLTSWPCGPSSPLPADHSFHASWFDIRRFVPQGFMALTAARICRCHLTHQLSPRLTTLGLRGHGTRNAVRPLPPPPRR